LNKFKNKISSVVNEDKRIEEIYRNILDSKINQKINHDFILEPQNFSKMPINKKAVENLDAKLKFKLGWIICNLRKLTNACDKKFLNESSQFEFLTKTLLNHLNEKGIESKNDDEIELELELLRLSSLEDDDQNESEEYDINNDVTAVSFNSEKINQWNFFNSFKDFDDSNFSYGSSLRQLTNNEYIEKMKTNYQFNSILIDHGRNLNEKEHSEFIDYTEDIAGSIEYEIQTNIDELKIDFPLIQKHIKELRMIIAKEWIGKYEKDLKNQRNSLSIIKTNETDDK
jgi:hypothetical protein